jgi:hypothetical protein
MSDGVAIMGFLQEPDVVLWRRDQNPYVLRSNRQASAIGERPRIDLTNSPLRRVSRKAIFIAELGDVRVTLLRPIPIHVEQAGDKVLGYSYDLDELEVDDDEWSVVNKMKASIVDLYYLLKEEQGNLGPVPQRHWNFLKKVIEEA